MSKPKFIIPDQYTTKSQRYEELLEEGIEWIQKFSGNLWTDYNFHDPGITFLEQLCFGITDLGYKTNFPISDVLFIGVRMLCLTITYRYHVVIVTMTVNIVIVSPHCWNYQY